MLRLTLYAAIILVLAIASGCQSQIAEGSKRIKIVSSLPLTGSSRLQTEMMERAIVMACEEVNYRVGSFSIEYQSWDDATAQAGNWDPAKEKEVASRAAADPEVMIYIGTYNSGAAKLSIPILNQAGLVMISPGATYTGLTKPASGEPGEPDIYYPSGQRNFCRVVPTDDLQGAAGASWAKSLGVNGVYILDDKELYGKGVANVFESECRRLGVPVWGRSGIDGRAPDFRAVISKLRATGAELVYYGGTIGNGAPKLVKDLRDSGSQAIFMGPDSLKDPAFLVAAGPAAEGVLCTLGSLPEEQMTEAAKRWYRSYRKRYGQEPVAFAVYAYEAARVGLAALNKVQSLDRNAVREAVMDTTDYKGLLGTWSFDANGDTTLSVMSGFKVAGGEFVFAKKLEAKPAVLDLKAGPSDFHSSRDSVWTLPEQLVTGLSNGALIAIIALGYTLVYGIVEMVNFAHGEVFMMGTLASLSLVQLLGLGAATSGLALWGGLALVLTLCMLFSGFLNAGMDSVIYRPLRALGSSGQAQMIAAMGCSFLLLNIGGYWKGWGPIDFPALLPEGNVLGVDAPFIFTFSQLFVLLTAIPILVCLYLFVYRTRLGKAMRAVAQNPEAAMLMGIDSSRTITLAFFLGGCLAGAAGLIFSLYNQQVFFQVGSRQGLNAFTAAVLGGIGNLPGALLGGLLIGVIEALSAYYLGQSLAPAVVFAVLILAIILRPSGLLGASRPEKV